MNPSSTITLNDGTELPRIGLGVFQITDVDLCETTVARAVDLGARLIDTAAIYRNERAVGRGIRSSTVPREEICVTTKLWPADYGRKRVSAAITRSVERLGTGHVDLMLLHRPHGDVVGAWHAMEDAVDRGLVRSIGVSNFDARDLERLMNVARIRPVVDQIELHPYWQQPDLVPLLIAEGIVPQAWYPLGHGSRALLAEPALIAIAARHAKSVVQVILRWHLQSAFVPLPNSTNPTHIAANLDVFDFTLSPEDMEAITALGKAAPLYKVPRWVEAAAARIGTPPPLR